MKIALLLFRIMMKIYKNFELKKRQSLKYSVFKIVGVIGTAVFAAAPLSFVVAAPVLSLSSSLQSSPLIYAISDNEQEDLLKGAQNFIDGIAQRGIDFLRDPDLTEEKRKKEFQKLLDDSFDMATIGRFSLGRYWNVATAEEKKRYLELFHEMIVDVYSDRFGEYKGQKLEVRTSRAEGKADVLVTSFLVSGSRGPEVQVDWRVRYKKGSYKVIDVIVEGVSMGVTQRSDFSSVIQRGGGKVEVLLTHLQTH